LGDRALFTEEEVMVGEAMGVLVVEVMGVLAVEVMEEAAVGHPVVLLVVPLVVRLVRLVLLVQKVVPVAIQVHPVPHQKEDPVPTPTQTGTLTPHLHTPPKIQTPLLIMLLHLQAYPNRVYPQVVPILVIGRVHLLLQEVTSE
jgi:hypothetical protein